MPFKSHHLRLYLDKPLYIAFINLQSDKTLGRSHAGLLAFVEGMHHMGYLSQKQYVEHKKRYSVPLDKDPQQVTLEEHNEALQLKKLSKTFADVIKQFDSHKHKPGWVEHWSVKAKKHGELASAKRLLAVIEEKKLTS